MQVTLPPRPAAPPIKIDDISQALALASDPAEIKEIGAKADAFEQYMHDSGLYSIEDMRPVNELRMRARWKLGGALKLVERTQGAQALSTRLTKSFGALLGTLGLTRELAVTAQRIGTMPEARLEKTLASARAEARLLHFTDLIKVAKPFWHKEKRRQNHQKIADAAAAAKVIDPDKFGPFALIYADPPWVFETHTPDMTHRMPDDHYPTLPDQEIIDLKFFGRTIPEMSTDNCALFMWCTSSNLVRALAVMEGWGFTYKTHAVWDKEKIGLGLIFRNQHEVLLYGSRGTPPKPLNLVSSVFRYKRGRHSAKPPEVRSTLEKMYPAFGADNRIELFCRGSVQGWASVGYEAASASTS